MAEFVKIIYGDSPAGVRIADSRKVAIIGTAASFTGVIDNISSVTTLESYGVTSADVLYTAVEDFLANANNSASVVAYAVGTGGTSVTDVELMGAKNGVNLTFSLPYSPITSITGVEYYTAVSGLAGDETGWFTVITGYSMTADGSIYNGEFVIDASGLTISGATLGEVSGLIPAVSTDRIRADITIPGIASATKELVKSKYSFQFIAFAYDPNGTNAEKYAAANCYSAQSWLADVYYGVAMAKGLNSNGQRCIFMFSLPEGVKPNEAMGTGFTSGTAYASGTEYWEELKNIVGTNKYAAPFVANQAGDANSIDPAIEMMANRMKASPRLPITFTPGAIAQTDYPDPSEVFSWENAHINVFGQVKGLTDPVWLGEYTFGAGQDADLNYIQCKNLLANKIEENLYTLLASRTLKYDADGMSRIRSAILAAEKELFALGYIDGIGTVTIPIESYILNESSLNSGDAITLANARTSKIVDNITVTFKWTGNIRKIVISAFINE